MCFIELISKHLGHASVPRLSRCLCYTSTPNNSLTEYKIKPLTIINIDNSHIILNYQHTIICFCISLLTDGMYGCTMTDKRHDMLAQRPRTDPASDLCNPRGGTEEKRRGEEREERQINNYYHFRKINNFFLNTFTLNYEDRHKRGEQCMYKCIIANN